MYISEFSQLSGVTVKTIRYYENIGLLPEPIRKGKYRHYDDTYVETVKQIKQAQELGFKLSEIKSFIQGENIKRGLPVQVMLKAINDKQEHIRSEIQNLKLKGKMLEHLAVELNRSPCMLDSPL
jgi:DNA-binding transcriptional MerR regulator